MIEKTAAELGRALRSREVSSVELTQAFLERINRYRDLNAFITVDPDRSLAQARAADARLAKGEGGVLTGIPIAQKDIFCTDGWLTTCGSKILSNFIAPYNAMVIEKLNAAGGVILGKTNMDEFAMGSSNETSFYAGGYFAHHIAQSGEPERGIHPVNEFPGERRASGWRDRCS